MRSWFFIDNENIRILLREASSNPAGFHGVSAIISRRSGK